VQGTVSVLDTDLTRRRQVVNAFLAAACAGDFDSLLAVLDPDVVIRADRGTLRVIRGAGAVAEGALAFSRRAESARLALVNGTPGIVSRLPDGRPLAVMGFRVTHEKIVEIDILADPARLVQLDLTVLDDSEWLGALALREPRIGTRQGKIVMITR
jgi:RNA polymerase sigma-70 factor (ECF subfamily)